jgi:hypothetical protein
MKQSQSHSTQPTTQQASGPERTITAQSSAARRPRMSEAETARWAESKELQPPK